MSLTDARRMWKLLNEAGTTGCHSHELRSQGVSGNPSQRAKDITSKGQPVFTAREPRGKRPGSRYWLQEHAPDWSVPVAPNGADLGSGPTLPLRGSAAEMSAEPYVWIWDDGWHDELAGSRAG